MNGNGRKVRNSAVVSQNRVLRTTFGSKRDDVTVYWRILHAEEINDLYSLKNCVSGALSPRHGASSGCG